MRDAALKIIADLVAFDTTPARPTLPLIDYVGRYLAQQGVESRMQVVEAGRHAALVARIGPDVSGGVVLSGHVDVVPVDGQDWKTDPFKLHNDGKRLYGRGTCDMKGFIGCVLAMVPAWMGEGLARPIYLALSCDEETSNKGVHAVLDVLRDEAAALSCVVIGEPTGMKVVSAHKGTMVFDVAIKGRACHSSHPELGLNAISVAHDVISFVRELEGDLREETHHDAFNPPYCTVNLGKIEGGSAANIVAGSCRLTWQLRQILNAQAEDVRARFMALLDGLRLRHPGVEVDCVEHDKMIPLEPRADNAAAALAQRLTGETAAGTVAYATEAGYFQKAGYAVAVCGPGHIEQAHAPDEFLALDQADRCLRFLKMLSARTSAGLV